METNSKKYIWTFFLVLITVMVASYIFNMVYTPESKPIAPETKDALSAQCITVKDETGQIIFQTGEPVNVEDEYIDEDDNHYIIIDVNDTEATAKIKDNTSTSGTAGSATVLNTSITNDNYLSGTLSVAAPLVNTHVAIYHTHTDESYTPTSGQASEPGKGDIFAVGKTLEDALLKEGVSVNHSDNTHDPHDINAYARSRETFVQLLKEQPDAVFDIHRDSAPTAAYATTVNGVESARVMIVIGRSNPNMQTNLDYARAIKAASDELHPGLMRGIFMGKGDYNQDLYPTAVLFEIGTESISQEQAEIAARSLSDAIITVLREK